jgi:hypothetical protein
MTRHSRGFPHRRDGGVTARAHRVGRQALEAKTEETDFDEVQDKVHLTNH